MKLELVLLEIVSVIKKCKPKFSLEDIDNPSILKDDFFIKNRPIRLCINNTKVISTVKLNNLVFRALISTNHVVPKSTMSVKSDSSLEANSSCCHKLEVQSNLVGSTIHSFCGGWGLSSPASLKKSLDPF